MMGHREPMKGGGEFDALTRGRHKYADHGSDRKYFKKKFNRRIRKSARNTLNPKSTLY